MSVDRNIPIIPTALTHAGVFHADDVFSAAILKMLSPDIQILRSNTVPDGYDGIVFDMGGGQFDHHSGEKKVRDNNAPYASFGLIWKEYGRFFLEDTEDYKMFDATFIEPIDLSDNNGEPNLLSSVISDFNPIVLTPESANTHFEQAIDFAITVLENRFEHIRYERKCVNEVLSVYEKQKGPIVILEKYIPWRKALIPTEAQFVIYPGARGGYNLQVVPVSEEDVTAKKDLPQAWWGKSGEELEQASGIKGLSFCHKNGFLCAADSLDVAKSTADAVVVSNQKGFIIRVVEKIKARFKHFYGKNK